MKYTFLACFKALFKVNQMAFLFSFSNSKRNFFTKTLKFELFILFNATVAIKQSIDINVLLVKMFRMSEVKKL